MTGEVRLFSTDSLRDEGTVERRRVSVQVSGNGNVRSWPFESLAPGGLGIGRKTTVTFARLLSTFRYN